MQSFNSHPYLNFVYSNTYKDSASRLQLIWPLTLRSFCMYAEFPWRQFPKYRNPGIISVGYVFMSSSSCKMYKKIIKTIITIFLLFPGKISPHTEYFHYWIELQHKSSSKQRNEAINLYEAKVKGNGIETVIHCCVYETYSRHI